MSKKDEMADKYIEKETEDYWIAGHLIVDRSSDEMKELHKQRFKDGWDACLLHDERVKALVEALEFYAKGGQDAKVVERHFLSNTIMAPRAYEALTQWKESIK